MNSSADSVDTPPSVPLREWEVSLWDNEAEGNVRRLMIRGQRIGYVTVRRKSRIIQIMLVVFYEDDHNKQFVPFGDKIFESTLLSGLRKVLFGDPGEWPVHDIELLYRTALAKHLY